MVLLLNTCFRKNYSQKLHKLKTLVTNDFSLINEDLLEVLFYNDLEIFDVDYITIDAAFIILENSGGKLKQILLKHVDYHDYFNDNSCSYSLEEILKKLERPPALPILTSDYIYERDEDYINLINKYKNVGVIKGFRCESVANVVNMDFKI
ncbi:hypothetical protein RCL_jg4851.t1 [Rhizophagus clarus]|uniref:Uncharacterized protein n=1 Tax=Rhizophagus clarus TaxID=94130 RepID=A0A8H3R674_9GLOM|nr:hypothetical protein RCL_jg4851.t1 [Rhizophagus clarus]